jgi:hypothetical protein
MYSHQAAGIFHVPFIVFPVFFFIGVGFDGSFQQGGSVGEVWVGEEGAQALRADDAFAQPGMHVAVAAQSFLRIIEVNDLQAGQADDGVEMS